jgi:hypothetical protein
MQGHGCVDHGQAEPFALLGGAARNGGKPRLVHPIRDRPAREDGMNGGNTKFGRFFHQPFHGIALERGDHQAEIGFRLGRAALRFQRDAAAILAECRDLPDPFAIPRIEDRHGIARASAQHGAQMMCLAGFSLYLKAGGKVGFKI